MSEVKRFALRLYNDCGGYSPEMVSPQSLPNPGSRLEYVLASDFDAAQAELAALREELARLDKLDTMQIIAELTKRLTAAEQRNAELVELLTRTLAYYTESCFPEDLLIEVKIAIGAVKPTESGASE